MSRMTYYTNKERGFALPEQLPDNDMGDTYSLEDICGKLAPYEDAEEQGRLVVLPCKSGDTIYQLTSKNHARGKTVIPRIVSCATVWADGNYEINHQGQTPCLKVGLNKTWFLSRVEAEQALNDNA